MDVRLLYFLPFAWGLSVNVPTNPFAGTTVSVTWTFNPNDPSVSKLILPFYVVDDTRQRASFVLDLHASLLSLDRVLDTVNTTAQSADVKLPSDEHGCAHFYALISI
jgi:hypothetical protein